MLQRVLPALILALAAPLPGLLAMTASGAR